MHFFSFSFFRLESILHKHSTQLTLWTGFILLLQAFIDDKSWRLQSCFRWLVFLFSVSGQFVSFLLVISISSPCCFLCLARTQLHNAVLDVFWAIWEYILSTRSQFTLCCFEIVFFLGLWVGELFWVFLEQRINSSKIYWPIKWKIKMFKPYGTFLKEQISDMLLQTFNFFPWACISCDFNWKLLVRVSLFLSTFFFYLIWNVLWSLFVWVFFLWGTLYVNEEWICGSTGIIES